MAPVPKLRPAVRICAAVQEQGRMPFAGPYPKIRTYADPPQRPGVGPGQDARSTALEGHLFATSEKIPWP